MTSSPSLLVVVPSAAVMTPAVRRAVALARAGGAALHLCMFEYEPIVDIEIGDVIEPAIEQMRKSFVDQARRRLAGLATQLEGQELNIEVDVVWAPLAHEAIVAKAEAVGAELVIKDPHRTSALRKALFTPLDWRLMRLLPCSLMLVQPGSLPRPRRILAGVDVLAEQAGDSAVGGRVLSAASGLARLFDARLDVASVFPYLPLHGPALLLADRVMERAIAEHRRAFLAFMDGHQVAPAHRHLLSGAPADALASHARDRDADLVVIGSSHRRGWSRLLLGSTAESLVQELDVDVLLVRPAPEAAAQRPEAGAARRTVAPAANREESIHAG